ncbi:PEP-CTERM sorting domain-containing protein [Roseateles sp.]|uniref:PEP-CTERM sorting domain-containing protein n=1 Tax=Roseateles sp. TaxID=1971397 RepID=UPI0039E98AA6
MTRPFQQLATLALTAGLLIASLATPTTADAATVTVNFSITSTNASADFYTIGTTGHGSFSFDDTLMPAGGTGQVGNLVMGLPTQALSFEWFGTQFDAGNASIATLRFAQGQLVDWTLGGRYSAPTCGLLRYGCVYSAGAEADFMLSASSGGPLNDGVHAGIGSGYGTVSWSVQAAPVPEPTVPALLALGLLFICWRRRNAQ